MSCNNYFHFIHFSFFYLPYMQHFKTEVIQDLAEKEKLNGEDT